MLEGRVFPAWVSLRLPGTRLPGDFWGRDFKGVHEDAIPRGLPCFSAAPPPSAPPRLSTRHLDLQVVLQLPGLSLPKASWSATSWGSCRRDFRGFLRMQLSEAFHAVASLHLQSCLVSHPSSLSAGYCAERQSPKVILPDRRTGGRTDNRFKGVRFIQYQITELLQLVNLYCIIFMLVQVWNVKTHNVWHKIECKEFATHWHLFSLSSVSLVNAKSAENIFEFLSKSRVPFWVLFYI